MSDAVDELADARRALQRREALTTRQMDVLLDALAGYRRVVVDDAMIDRAYSAPAEGWSDRGSEWGIKQNLRAALTAALDDRAEPETTP